MCFIDIHTHHNSASEHQKIINIFPSESSPEQQLFSCGIHPWYIDKKNLSKQWENLELKLSTQNCIALGECGIDKHYSSAPLLQEIIFEKHINLAEIYQKPLIIHCVKAYNDIIRLKKKWNPSQKWIIHGINKRYQNIQQLIKYELYLSYGAAILTNSSTQESLKRTPLHLLFLETDNSNVEISEIYQKAAKIKEISIEELALHLQENFKNLTIKK